MKRLFPISVIGLLIHLLIGTQLSEAQSYFTSKVTGSGKPMILIHGLYSNGEVWNETVDHFKNDYECHVITLAGFGGTPANLNDHFLESVKDDIIAYTKANKLDKPILIGHSMGGFLALWAAASAPGFYGKVVSVDGAPSLAELSMPGLTADSTRSIALTIKKTMAEQGPEEIFNFQKAYLSTMMRDSERIEQVATIAKNADSQTQAQVMYELFMIDLRKTVAAIDCPVLTLGAWVAYRDYGATHDSVLKNHNDQLALVNTYKVELNNTAKHFIFYDDPQWFYAKLDEFLVEQ